jgi:hypothetical protein
VKFQSLRRLLEPRLRTKLLLLRTTRHLLGPEPLVVVEVHLREVAVEAELRIEEVVAHVAALLLLLPTELDPRRTLPCLFPQRSLLSGALRIPRWAPQRRRRPFLNNLPSLRLLRHPSLLLPQ